MERFFLLRFGADNKISSFIKNLINTFNLRRKTNRQIYSTLLAYHFRTAIGVLFGSSLNRNYHMKHASCADGALRPDFSVIFINEFFAENQSEPGARLAASTCGGACFGEGK